MRFRLSSLLALLAAVQILGGHWMALQSVAWVGMVIDYSQQAPLSVAIEKTFDGAHPCGLCEKVTQGRQDEQKNDAVRLVVKFEAVLATPSLALPLAGQPWTYPRLVERLAARNFPPPTPPPLA